MFEETVISPNGVSKRVVAGSQAELKEAVDSVKNEAVRQDIDINVPVKKGHDLVTLSDGGVTVGLSDGTGAHNSPRNAIDDNGKLEGNPDEAFLVQKRNVGTVTATNDNMQKVVADGKLVDATPEDLEPSVDVAEAAPVAPNRQTDKQK